MSNDDGSTWITLESLGVLASANAWTPVGFDLQTFGPLTAQMKLRVRSADGPTIASVVESAIDDVTIVGAHNCTSAVPGAPGAIAPGSLQVEREGQKIRMSWAAECGGGTGYGIYRGDLAAGYDSLAAFPSYCGVGGTSASFDPGPDSYFFLVAPNDGSFEGSLGRSSDGTLRAQPSNRCWPRWNPINACAP